MRPATRPQDRKARETTACKAGNDENSMRINVPAARATRGIRGFAASVSREVSWRSRSRSSDAHSPPVAALRESSTHRELRITSGLRWMPSDLGGRRGIRCRRMCFSRHRRQTGWAALRTRHVNRIAAPLRSPPRSCVSNAPRPLGPSRCPVESLSIQSDGGVSTARLR